MYLRARTVTAGLAVAAALALAATGCGKAQQDSPSGGTDLGAVTLKVGATGWTSVAAALKTAHLDDTPYRVQWPVFPSGDKQLQAIQAGALDVGSSSEIPPVFAAASTKLSFKEIAVQHSTTLQQEVVVGKNSPITDIAGLKGHKVAYVANTTAQYFLYKLLGQAGLNWSDISPAPLAPNDGVAALNGGAVDALASYGNSIIAAHQAGGRTIGSGQDILSGNFPWIASDAVLADAGKRAALVDLLVRISKAYAYLRTGHQQEYVDAVADATHQPAAQALDQFNQQEAQRPTALVPTSPQAIASQQSVADAFTALRAVPKKVDVATIWSGVLDDQLRAALTAAGLSAA
jgi:sulfonate transport system substrate-binding protein